MNRYLHVIAAVIAAACAGADTSSQAAPMDLTARVAVAEGLAGPEAVRYDPGQDVYFVSNFNGEAAGDSNGFVSRVRPDGTVDSLRFMTGTAAAVLHGPRGLFITGDTLWAADADGLHAWDRHTGTHLAFVDFRPLEPGFLNDVSQGPDGALYITDTGRSRIYRLAGGVPEVAVDDPRLGPPNGITWDPGASRFVVAPWEEQQLYTWAPGGELESLGSAGVNRCDGVEIVGAGVLVACQADSSLRVLGGAEARQNRDAPARRHRRGYAAKPGGGPVRRSQPGGYLPAAGGKLRPHARRHAPGTQRPPPEGRRR